MLTHGCPGTRARHVKHFEADPSVPESTSFGCSRIDEPPRMSSITLLTIEYGLEEIRAKEQTKG